MPGWVDMRETRRIRERVTNVASSSLPYWNAQGSYASTGLQMPLASEFATSDLPFAQKLALISDNHSACLASERSSESGSDVRPGLRADKAGRAKLLNQRIAQGPLNSPNPKARSQKLPAQRRKVQPKQGPSKPPGALGPSGATASAAAMASRVRRQLLELCQRAGLQPGILEVEDPVPEELPTPWHRPFPASASSASRQRRPGLATQLRRATMERAQRERKLQRQSQAVQTTQESIVPEIFVQMRPEPHFIPRSVQLEGHHWETADRGKALDTGSEMQQPAWDLFQQNGQASNAFEEEIVIGELFPETKGVLDHYLEMMGSSPSQFQGPPPHKPRASQQLQQASRAGHELEQSSKLDKLVTSEIEPEERWQESLTMQAHAMSCQAPRGLGESGRSWHSTRARGENDPASYDVTVFQALCRKTFDPKFSDPAASTKSQPSLPSSVVPSEPLDAKEDVIGPDVDPQMEAPVVPMQKPLDLPFHSPYERPERSPEDPERHERLDPDEPRSESSADSMEDFLAADAPVEPVADTSGSELGISQELEELPPLPTYQPLPSLRMDRPEAVDEGAGAVPRLAPKQLEEQFYSSLQILDSVHEHLAQVDLLSQQRVLHRQYSAQHEQERKAGLEAQIAQQAQLESTIAWLDSTRMAQQQLLQHLQCQDEEAHKSRQEFVAEYHARELQRQEDTEILERERLEREQSILERQREMLLVLGLTLDYQA